MRGACARVNQSTHFLLRMHEHSAHARAPLRRQHAIGRPANGVQMAPWPFPSPHRRARVRSSHNSRAISLALGANNRTRTRTRTRALREGWRTSRDARRPHFQGIWFRARARTHAHRTRGESHAPSCQYTRCANPLSCARVPYNFMHGLSQCVCACVLEGCATGEEVVEC